MNRFFLQWVLPFLALQFLITHVKAQKQQPDRFFRMASPAKIGEKDYGQIRLAATNNTILVNSILAYGEQVKSLTVSINGGFPFKLAPAPSGQNLNYVGSALQLVLQPGDVALFSFLPASGEKTSTPPARHIFLSGTYVDP